MNRLCIFAKPPVAGKTKSRLSTEIGELSAAELSACMLQYLIDEARFSSANEIFLYVPHDACLSEYKEIDCRGLTIKYQLGNDLGEKMSNLFLENINELNNVILIGSDCVSVEISLAFEKLKNHSLVVQPAEDGGYVLIGMKSFYFQLFKNIHWGTNSVMHDTKKILEQLNINFSILETGFDIDEKRDLIKLEKITHKQHAIGIKKWLEKNLK